MAAVLAALLLAAVPVPALVREPDLRVASVATQERAAAPGRLHVPTTIENAGTRSAHRSRTRYWLSRDAERGRDVRLRSVRVPAIGAGDAFGLTASLRVRAATKSGAYHVIACADAGRRVGERREGNNCLVSERTIAIRRRTAPQIPPGPR